MVTITKVEWLALWAELKDEWYHDASTFPDCGDADLPEVFEGDSTLCFQGRDPDKINRSLFKQSDVVTGAIFSTVFRRWKKLQSTSVLVIEVPKARLEEIKTELTKLGIKV